MVFSKKLNFLFKIDIYKEMIFSAQKDLEDIILEDLLTKAHTAKSIHTYILQLRKDVTLRAVYKAVHKLIDAGVVIKVGKEIILNKEWTQTVIDKLGQTSSLHQLSTGESIIYTLTSPTHMDTYWKTIFSSLPAISYNEPVFFYNPHDFWIFVPGRQQSEDVFYKNFAKDKTHCFFTIGGTSELDMDFKRQYRSDYLKINLEPIRKFKRTEHVTVWGSHIITVILPLPVARKVDIFYQDNNKEKLIDLLQENFKVKIKIEHKPRKAKKLRKLLSKNFYIPKEMLSA